MFLTDGDVLAHLRALNVSTELVLILDDLVLQESNFLH